MTPPIPPNGKSGLIRKRLGPRIANLKRLIVDGRQLQKRKPDVDTEDGTADLLDAMEEMMGKLQTSIEKIETDNEEWLALISTLSDLDKPAEEALYSYWATENDGEKSYIFLIDDGSSLLAALKLKTNRLRPPEHSSTFKRDHNTSSSSRNSTTANRRSAKLRPLQLPMFSGDPLAFKEFWALFSVSVDQEDYDSITKFSYLRQQLRGSASDALAGLEITEENYNVAVQILRERFEKTTSEIIGTLYSKLKLMSRCVDHPSALRKTYDSVKKIVRQLKNVGVEVNSNQLLVMDILSKFPELMIREITMRKNIDVRSTVEETEKALGEYIEQAELLSGMVNDLKPFVSHTKPLSNTGYSQPTEKSPQFAYKRNYNQKPASFSQRDTDETSAFATVDNVTTPKRECVFCGALHFHAECPNYETREVRQKRLEEIGKCERCLCQGHSKDDCRTRKFKIKCFYCKSIGDHPSAMCSTRGKYGETPPKEIVYHQGDLSKTHSKKKEKSKAEQPITAKTTVNSLTLEENSLLSTALATISNPETGQTRQVRLIFDNCSHRSYLTDNVIEEIQLSKRETTPLKVAVFGHKNSVTLNTKLVDVCIHLRDNRKMKATVNSTPVITSCSLTPVDLPEETKELLRTMKSALAEDFESPHGAPEFLIGADLFWEFITGSKLKSSNGIYLIPTSLGMVLGGCYKNEKGDNEESVMLCLTERKTFPGRETALSSISQPSRADIEPDITEFWSLETIGIKEDPCVNDDEITMINFNKTVKYANGRYEVEWPWRDNHHELPTNYNLALGRLKSLLKRFKETNSALPGQYGDIFREQVTKSIIEKVPDKEVLSSANITHYLAHHAVVKDNHLTTKVRIVFDGSAKCGKQKPCLNECLMRGPVILPDLCAVLLRFRLKPVAVVSDIEKAFHQIALKRSQRDAVRFLWLKDDTKLETGGNIQIYRFQRVPFGTISSPFLLAATLLHHLRQYDSKYATKIAANMYVDNCILALENEQEASAFYNESKTIFQKAGMNLREYCSNSDSVFNAIPAEDRCSTRLLKVLGLQWDSTTDFLRIQNSWRTSNYRPTKREILKAAAEIFDPLGWFQPVTLRIKCFIRDVWNIKCNWDDTIPDDFAKRWETIRKDTLPMFQISVPRFIACLGTEATIITFTDASADAYAASVYIRVKHSNKWQAFLIFSKSRLAPKVKWKAEITIPRLELLGLTIGTRMSQFVRQALIPTTKLILPVHLFCDSSCVLSWIRNDKPMDRFITNRVKEIRKIEGATFWHVKGDQNPADLATRSATADELSASQLWWQGPYFLEHAEEKWPRKDNLPPITSKEIQNIAEKKQQQHIYLPGTLLVGEGSTEKSAWTPCDIDPARISTLQKLLRITVFCLKFVKYKVWNRLSKAKQHACPKLQQMFNAIADDSVIRTNEMTETLHLWIRALQDSTLGKVRASLSAPNPHQLCRELNLELDERGILRCVGRLLKADLPEDAIQPILLPKEHHVTRLIISDSHRKTLHSGVRHTLSELRRRFWVPQGRQAVQSVITQCRACKRYRSHPFALPKMPALPRERVARAKPFEYTGLDFVGPINIKLVEETRKCWICLFTCLAVRAVHLEWILDCTVQTFVDCLSRFISRRGTPRKIISDNAAQFHLTDRLFHRIWKQIRVNDDLLSYIAKKGIEWTFTTELAPWQGGVYERLVGVVKNTMRTQIGRKLLKFETFTTLLTEVEAVVNSRPITFVYSRLDSGHSLRPMDFLSDLPTGTPSIDPSLKPEGGDAGKSLLRHWKDKQRKLDQYWKLWYSEYLLSLRERDKREHKNKRTAKSRTPEVNEIVLVEDEDAPRGMWKLARIAKLLGTDDIRAAELVLPNRHIIRRPLNKLYSLEIPTTAYVENVAPNRAIVDVEVTEDEDFLGFEESEVEAAKLRLHYENRAALADNQRYTTQILLAGLKSEEVQPLVQNL